MQVMLAGATSGVGKTTLTLGILRALVKRQLNVQPFKVGPDYVDTSYHQLASGTRSINLDQFMIPDAKVLKALYHQYLPYCDIAVVEGVMGLYDGFGSDKWYCSSAGMAKNLNLPVILVIDGKATSTSAAAIVEGFNVFGEGLNLAGVIVNRVGSESHFQLIRQAIERYTEIPVLGYLPNNPKLTIPSRQLGLVPQEVLLSINETLDLVAEQIEATVDLDQLLAIANQQSESIDPVVDQEVLATYVKTSEDFSDLTIAYAKDEAFSFYYAETFDLMRSLGANVITFSPIRDQKLPEADLYYFGGGYLELYVEQLSANHSMLESVRSAHQQQIPIYAETGGLTYLTDRLETEDESYSLVGILPGVSRQAKRLQRFGYTTMEPLTEILIASVGDRLHGHEFHYSTFETELSPVAKFYKKRDQQLIKEWLSAYQVDQTFASFMQIHFYQDPQLMIRLLTKVKEQKYHR